MNAVGVSKPPALASSANCSATLRSDPKGPDETKLIGYAVLIVGGLVVIFVVKRFTRKK